MNELNEILARSEARRRLPEPDDCRLLRRRAFITQQEIALVVGVDRATVARWESGARKPRGKQLTRYLSVLDALGASR
jgi:DNA-binding transcriptional regulator YiaG